MNARKLFYHKETRGDVIVEMVIWQLPEKSIERPHRLKYRFFCGTTMKQVKAIIVTMVSRKCIIISSRLRDWLKIFVTTVPGWRVGSGNDETH
jgi:hypothetical protein